MQLIPLNNAYLFLFLLCTPIHTSIPFDSFEKEVRMRLRSLHMAIDVGGLVFARGALMQFTGFPWRFMLRLGGPRHDRGLELTIKCIIMLPSYSTASP